MTTETVPGSRPARIFWYSISLILLDFLSSLPRASARFDFNPLPCYVALQPAAAFTFAAAGRHRKG